MLTVIVESGNKVLIMERRPTKSHFIFQEEINHAKERERAVTMAMEGGMFEEVMTVITSTEVASKVFINKVFSIQNNQSSKDIFMNEDDEEEVSSFYSLSLLNNNEPLPLTTRPLWWWFTKDVLRRTTEGGTQLDEEDNDKDEEGAEEVEAERRSISANRGIKVRVRGGSLVEERRQGGACKRENYARTHFISLLLYVSCGE